MALFDRFKIAEKETSEAKENPLQKQMKVKFIKTKFVSELKIPKNLGKVLKDNFSPKSELGIYCAVQFIEFLPKLKKELLEYGHNAITSTPKRAALEGQVLGCDSSAKSLNLEKSEFEKIGGFVYLGDGNFHPLALVYAQENETEIKPVISINPISEQITVFTKNDIDKYLKRKKGNLARFHMSEKIGVYISSKWGQERKDFAIKLKKAYPNKTFYFFVSDFFGEQELENFPFVEVWVNTACPRIGQDDILRHSKAIVNIWDVLK